MSIDTKQLKNELKEWFNEIKIDKNFWHKDEIGTFIKEELIKLGHWKNRSASKRQINKEILIKAREIRKNNKENKQLKQIEIPPIKQYTDEDKEFLNMPWNK